jgi:GNAT superfamily N-acetyltransferase
MMSPPDTADGITIDCDRARLDVDLIHGFLAQSYWAQDIPRRIVERSIENSLNFGLYDNGQQIGYARVISDFATFAYLADAFVIESRRGQGLAGRLVRAVLAHPELQDLRRWMLVTRDAHGVYAREGFNVVAAPDRFMEKHAPGLYQRMQQRGL